MKIMGIKGSWLWLGGFSGSAGAEPITLGRLLCFCAAPALAFCEALAHSCASGQGWSCSLARGGFENTREAEINNPAPRRVDGLGRWLPQAQGFGQCPEGF